MGAGLYGLDRQSDAIGKGQYLGPEEVAVEELGMELEIFGFDIGEDDDVVFLEHALILSGRHVVEVPGGHAHDLVSTAGLNRVHQPLPVVDDVQSLGCVVEGGLRIDRSDLYSPVADIIRLGHLPHRFLLGLKVVPPLPLTVHP